VPELPPLSKRFLEFAGSDLPAVDDEAHYLGVVRIYAMAWNRAVFPDGSHNATAIADHIAEAPAEVRIPLQMLHAELIARKKRLFPEDVRIIADCRLRRDGRVVSLQVLHADASRVGSLPLPFS
jgi:hypothetical protein